MGVEAFLWPYEGGEPSAFRIDDVLEAFGDAVAGRDPESGRLRLDFGGPPEVCDVFCGEASPAGLVRGLTIDRPVRSLGLWRGVLRLMSGRHAVLFFSDDTTPLFRDPASAGHLPPDLLAELGTPVRVETPEDIVARRGG